MILGYSLCKNESPFHTPVNKKTTKYIVIFIDNKTQRSALKLSVERAGVFRYWAAGAVTILVGWASLVLGFVGFLLFQSGNVAVFLVYTLAYAIMIPYVLGRLVGLVVKEILSVT